MRSVVCILFLTILSGCEYERSFMNLNSDSGVPFLGLQMSVDARDFGGNPSDDKASVTTVAMSTNRPPIPIQTESARAQSPQWINIPSSPPNAEHIKQLSAVPADDDPIAEIERRLSAF